MPRGFYSIMAAQFFSALADNALLIVAMAFLHEQGYPAWWAPLLKFAFTWAYVLLAPGVGHLADAYGIVRVYGATAFLPLLGLATAFRRRLMAEGVETAASGAAPGHIRRPARSRPWPP